MPRGIGEVHVSVPLSNVAIKYKEPAFVAEEIFPVVKVAKEADKYYVFGREHMRHVDDLRALNAPAREVDWGATPHDYSCDERALRTPVPYRIRDNADVALKPAMSSTVGLVKRIRRGQEKRVQAIAQSTTYITNFHNVVTPWDADSGADPFEDVKQAKISIRKNAGVNPNRILMNQETSLSLLNWLKLTAYTTYKEWLDLGKLPPKLWNLQVVEAGSVEDTAIEGQPASMADIWNDNVLVYYREPGLPSLTSMTLGWILRQRIFQTKKWEDNERDSTVYQVSVIQAEKLVCYEAGYLLVGALTGTGS